MSEENKLQGLFTNTSNSNRITTENGANALASSESTLLDYFFSIVRGSDKERIHSLLDLCWKESPQDTLKLIFYKRDCRGGAGERKVFLDSYEWLFSKHPCTAKLNFPHIPEYGYWKEIFWFWPQNAVNGAELVASKLREDKKNLEEKKSISLLAKWLPTTDKEVNAVPSRKILFAIARKLNLVNNGKWHERLRKTYIAPLRRELALVETNLCGNNVSEIDYSKVPSIAFNRYKKLFAKKDGDRFSKWMEDVKEGKQKINTSVLFPHDIVSKYIDGSCFSKESTVDEATELQWQDIVKRTSELGVFNKCIAISDVSGSMAGLPMQVSVALGMLIAECNTNEFFSKKLITFSEEPRFLSLTEETLRDRVEYVFENVGYNTNFQRVFGILLDYCVENQVPRGDMPEKLFVFSDMQFDDADGQYNKTTFEVIQNMYSKAGYTMPEMIFWNLRDACRGVPVKKDERNTMMVSGFSEKILSQIMTGSNLTPMGIMMDVLESSRYDRLEVAEEDQ